MKHLFYVLCVSLLCACCASSPFTNYSDLVVTTTKPSPSDTKQSIVAEMSKIDDQVENGDAYEKVSFRLPPFIRELHVPKEVTVIIVRQNAKVTMFLKKHLGFAGHPGKFGGFTSIRNEKEKMWSAIQIHSHTLGICLYGSWDSEIEGGADINAVILVPLNIKVKRQKGLNFFQNASRGTEEKYRPAEWFVLPTSPDAIHLFDRYSPSTE